MAANNIPQGTYRDVQVLSATAVITVQVETALTQPSNIYFETPVPLEAWQSGSGPEYRSTAAAGLEQLLQEGDVVSVYWTQDLDTNGLRADYGVATVQIPTPAGKTGPFQTEVSFTMGVLSADQTIRNAVVVPALEAAVKQLEATAAG